MDCWPFLLRHPGLMTANDQECPRNSSVIGEVSASIEPMSLLVFFKPILDFQNEGRWIRPCVHHVKFAFGTRKTNIKKTA